MGRRPAGLACTPNAPRDPPSKSVPSGPRGASPQSPASQPKACAAPQPCSHLPHGPRPQLARDENGRPRKLSSQDGVHSNVSRGRRWLPGYKLLGPGARAHTPEAHPPSVCTRKHAHMHTRAVLTAALGPEVRACYLQGSRFLEARAGPGALRSLACRVRGSWTPRVQLTRSSSAANSWG